MADTTIPNEDAQAASTSAVTEQLSQMSLRKIQVSSNKKPLYFFVGRAKSFLQEDGEVHLSALGQAISTMVSVVEILKKEGLAKEKRLATSLEHMVNHETGRSAHKVKMEVVLAKTPDFDRIMAEQKEQRAEQAQLHAAAAEAPAGAAPVAAAT